MHIFIYVYMFHNITMQTSQTTFLHVNEYPNALSKQMCPVRPAIWFAIKYFPFSILELQRAWQVFDIYSFSSPTTWIQEHESLHKQETKTSLLPQPTLSTNDQLTYTQRSMQRAELMIKSRCPSNEASPVGDTSVLLHSLFAESAVYMWISISSSLYMLPLKKTFINRSNLLNFWWHKQREGDHVLWGIFKKETHWAFIKWLAAWEVNKVIWIVLMKRELE